MKHLPTLSSSLLVLFASLFSISTVGAMTPDGTETTRVTVTAEAVPSPTPNEDWKAKLDHIMREVSGTEITVTKKATVIKLDQQPPVENNNNQELFTKAPGLLITEQHTPGQFNFSYRGLGNPQESEFVTVLENGLPLASDWIGFPTLYFLPLPQSVSEIQMIRGGSSLLYGPEPAPAVNFITRYPAPGSPLDIYTEQIGGAYGLYSTYNVIQGTRGPWEFRADGGYVHSDGQRDNSAYDLWQANGYVGYRPDKDQLWAVDVHLSQFNGGDPGVITYQQFLLDPDFSPTPNAHDWVDRYSFVFRHEHDLGDGWLLQAKAWFTNQDIDQRGQFRFVNIHGLPTAVAPLSIEDFWNGGVDVRLRKNWGEGTMFKGSTLTFGGTVYHGEAPFFRYNNLNVNADPNDGGIPTLDQDRSSDYQAFFVEDLIRLGKWHFVPSFRLDHEHVEVDTNVRPFDLGSVDADHWVPLWGFGMGNDFGHLNETYFSASSGWRPTRFFDISSPFQNFGAANQPDPFHSLDFELGVHGTPIKGFWYDVGAFWMVFDNRTETLPVGNSPGEFIINNSGDSRSRGFEGEISYDFLAGEQEQPAEQEVDAKDFKSVKQAAQETPSRWLGYHLILFSNIQLLDAEFTESKTGLTGNTPAFAPSVLYKGGLTLRKENCFDASLTAVYVADQFGLDSNQPVISGGIVTVPAKIPAYKVLNFSADWYITKHLKLIAGVSNLTNEKYYSRVFLNGFIEPAPERSGYAGLAYEF